MPSPGEPFDPRQPTADFVPAVTPQPETVSFVPPEQSTEIKGSFSGAPANAPTIPGYRITAEIAKGGMGRVYAAFDEMLDREVAIKTLLLGANAERFVTEARITARLPHPAIPPVHALGTLPDGTPWLAMKRIHGQTLSLLLRARPSPSHELPRYISVFEQIAQAVGFAHSRGIIHRDLKPLNVMVGEFGEVQVMDWGLAKDISRQEVDDPSRDADDPSRDRANADALSRDRKGAGNRRADAPRSPSDQKASGKRELPGETPEHTAAGTILGTPGYMAPEQARGEVVDQRADVFALGSILATILTGQPAFVGHSKWEILDKSARADLSEVMTRLDACTADAELIALCKRCLSAKPEDRPKDGQAVAAEVAAYRASVEQRLRQAETDRARAETQAAEQRKRRRVWIGLAATLFIGLVASSALAAWAMQAERVASAERDAKDEALREAERNLGFCRKGNELLGSVFSSLDPYSHYATVAEFRGVLKQSLRKAVAELEGTAIGDPLTVAAMQNTLGGSLLGLGEGELAIAMFEKSWSTRKDVLGPNHADTLTSMNNLALGYQVAGKWDEAIALTEKTLQRMRSALGPDHADTLACMNNLAMGYRDLGQMDKAQRLLQETVNLMRTKFGEDHPTTLASMNNLAECYRNTGLIDKAVLLHTEIMKLRQARLGSDHPRTLESMSNLAAAHHAAGRLDASLSLLEETLPLMRSRLGSDHPHTLAAMNNLAFAYKETEKLEKALALYQESLRLKRAKLGDDHPETLTTINNLAECYRKLGQMGRVVSLLEETVRLRRRKLGNDHPATINSIGNLGAAYCAVCDGERAAPLLKEFITGSRKQYPANDPKFANLLTFISLDLLGCGQFAPAEEMLRECLAIREKIQPDDWNTFNTVFLLGEALLGQKKYAEAEPLLVKGYEGMKQALRAVSAQEPRSGDASSFAVSIRIAEALERLIQHYDNTDQAEEAAKYRNAMADWWRERITRQPLSQLIWGWPRW